MYPISHVMAGFMLAVALELTGFVELTGFLIAVSVVASLLPDLDAFLVDDMAKHHDGFLHAPLFWLIATFVIYVAGYPLIALVGGLSLILHLFTDFVTARTVGIKAWYPFSDVQYSMFETDPVYGRFNPSRPGKEDLKKHLSHYVENKPALIFEAVINVIGAASVLYLLLI